VSQFRKTKSLRPFELKIYELNGCYELADNLIEEAVQNVQDHSRRQENSPLLTCWRTDSIVKCSKFGINTLLEQSNM